MPSGSSCCQCFYGSTITKADSFLSSIQPVDDLTDDELRAKARLASGREPKVFVTPSPGVPKEFDSCFDDGSLFNVEFVAPGGRHITVLGQAPEKPRSPGAEGT